MAAKTKTRGRGRRRAIKAKALAPTKAVPVDMLTDGRARFKAYFWAITLTFGYGVVAEKLLGRPSDRVNVEAAVVCLATLIAHHVLHYVRRIDLLPTFRKVAELFEKIQRFEHWRFAPATAASGVAVFVAIIVFAGTPPFQAKILDYRLQNSIEKIFRAQTAAASEKLTSPYKKIESIIHTSQAYDLPVDTKPVLSARRAIQDSLARPGIPEEVRASGWKVMADLGVYADYRKVQEASLTPQPASALGLKGDQAFVFSSIINIDNQKLWLAGNGARLAFGDSGFFIKKSIMIFDDFEFVGLNSAVMPIILDDDASTVMVRNSQFTGVTQGLRGVSWIDVKFQNSIILYSGGAVNLKNVTFENCEFRFAQTRASQELRAHIQSAGGQPVTFAAAQQ